VARRPTPFTAIAVNRNGLAIYINGQGVAALKQRTGYAGARGLDPAFLGLAGGTIAWRANGAFPLQALLGGNDVAAPLLSAGGVHVCVTRNHLFARLGDGAPRELGIALDECESSSGCGGIASIQIEGDYLAALETGDSAGNGWSQLRIYDLARRRARRVCLPGRGGGYLNSFVLTRSGHAVCALSGTPSRIIYGSANLDAGPGLDTSSLTRRGERLVWTDGGVERPAPHAGEGVPVRTGPGSSSAVSAARMTLRSTLDSART
jgi:hypothetical protein